MRTMTLKSHRKHNILRCSVSSMRFSKYANVINVAIKDGVFDEGKQTYNGYE